MSLNQTQKTKKPDPRMGYVIIGLLTIAAITLLILPKDYFDNGRPMCLSVLLLNKECYGCGMTRGIQHLLHLDFETAYHYNKLSFVVLPLFTYMTIWEIRKRFFKKDE
ncbi:MAG: DUF2752 domain-containing protein [Bacteroidota bacterium]